MMLPDPHERLELWKAERAFHEERRKVSAAREKAPSERTGAEWAVLAYSPLGTASKGCGCRAAR
jgi:hypothetical protein